jgi:hypothetical protein
LIAYARRLRCSDSSLAMMSSAHADGWVLKGAQVLLARLDEHARATNDVDTTWRFEADALRSALDDADHDRSR